MLQRCWTAHILSRQLNKGVFTELSVHRMIVTAKAKGTSVRLLFVHRDSVESPEGRFSPVLLSLSNIEARAFYSYALQALPGVRRSGKPPPVAAGVVTNHTQEPWKPFNRHEQSPLLCLCECSDVSCVVTRWRSLVCPGPECTWPTWSRRCITRCVWSWLLIPS